MRTTSAEYRSLTEPLDDAPLHDEVRCLLRAMIDRGERPVEVIEAALATSTAFCVEAEGLSKTSDPFDCLSGSTGLTGTADTTLVLARDSQGTTLYGRRRDIDEIESALAFDRTTGHWTLLGAAADVRRSDERGAVLQALREAKGPMSPKDIMIVAGLESRNALDVLLYRMAKAGEIEKAGRGLCYLPGLHNPCKNAKNVRSRHDPEGDEDD